ncbi:Kef-type K+ transport system membrane component KefB [Silvimonas terrae]|uniref:Kef-type K+ transport system membrane component KefB n=1 Tax=Silvimonas terrae TaxID=300266 RepID=A0A840RIN0_9NEIS|nr:cation:proton antiporter [Silvimonas terrae]MBB5192166.1 Kef-type K+ transport system membrane component KefB [Silvimonas terrae]
MQDLDFLPSFPFEFNVVALFGILLVAAFVGGGAVHKSGFLPRITGFTLVGMLLGNSGLEIIDSATVLKLRPLLDIALGVVLFEFGQRLDFKWWRQDRWLAVSCITESILGFALAFGALLYLGQPPLLSGMAAAIGISTSPAVLWMIARDTHAEGQLTDRAMNLVAANGVIAFITVSMLLAFLHLDQGAPWRLALLHPLWVVAGSILLGFVGARSTLWLVGLTSRTSDSRQAVVLGMVMTAIGFASVLHFSVLITLLVFGVFIKNMDHEHRVAAVDTGRYASLFLAVLFVITGASLSWHTLMLGGLAALVFTLARFVGKFLGVLLISPFSGLGIQKSAWLGLVLLPVSGTALVLAEDVARLYPQFGETLRAIVLGSVALLELIGPIVTQLALRMARETRQN